MFTEYLPKTVDLTLGNVVVRGSNLFKVVQRLHMHICPLPALSKFQALSQEFSPLTRSLLQVCEPAITSRVAEFSSRSLLGRHRLLLQGALLRELEDAALQPDKPCTTFAEAVQALECLLTVWIAGVECASLLLAKPLEMLRARGVPEPERRLDTSSKRWAEELLALWGIVQEFPALHEPLRRGVMPDLSVKGNRFFSSACVWMRRRHGARAFVPRVALEPKIMQYKHAQYKHDVDVAAPRAAEWINTDHTPEAHERRTVLFQWLLTAAQPETPLHDWDWDSYTFAVTLLWQWAERLAQAQDGIFMVGLEQCAALRAVLLSLGEDAVRRTMLPTAEALWECDVETVRRLDMR